MYTPTPEERKAIVRKLEAAKERIAANCSDTLLSRNPEWLQRFGARANAHCRQDAEYHIDFLCGAVRLGETTAFSDYIKWACRMLAARSIDPAHVLECLEQLERECETVLDARQAESVRSFLAEGMAACSKPEEALSAKQPSAPLHESMNVFLQAILKGDRRASMEVAKAALLGGFDVLAVYECIFQEALYEVGRLWELNKITVAEEHIATATMQSVLSRIYEELPRERMRRGKALVTGVQGELHQVGGNMVSDLWESRGWDVQFLGTQLPHDGILRAIDTHQPTVVGISTTVTMNVPKAAALIESIRKQHTNRPLRIIVGGRAFMQCHNTWRDIGADWHAKDLAGAMAYIQSL